MKSFLFALPLAAAAALSSVAAFPIVSNDGVTRDFPVIRSASRDGLVVRSSPTGRDISVPWERLDLAACKLNHPWLATVHSRATAGETITLDLGLGRSPDDLGDWRTRRQTVAGGAGKNFTSLSLTAYIHREVAHPRLAIVWVGSKSPLATRADAADFARRYGGAMVMAEFSGDFADAALGSGEALVHAIPGLLAPKVAPGQPRRITAPPALIVLGEGPAASFVWSLLVHHNAPILAAVCIDGAHDTRPNANSFLTPLLLMETKKRHHGLEVSSEDTTQPFDLWRHYSTEGCRWTYLNPVGQPDPLALAVSYCEGVAAASPYREVLENLESWENNELKNRIPMPTRTVKDFREDKFLLGTLGARQTFPVNAKKGDARHDLIWLPSPEFARAAATVPTG